MAGTKVIVGLGSCGIAAGAGKVYEKLKALKDSGNLDFQLAKTSCVGMCYREPLVEIVNGSGWFLYGDVSEDMVDELVESHIINNNPVAEYVVCTDLV
jgi:NADH-quinone oxidoreductase subunit F